MYAWACLYTRIYDVAKDAGVWALNVATLALSLVASSLVRHAQQMRSSNHLCIAHVLGLGGTLLLTMTTCITSISSETYETQLEWKEMLKALPQL